MVLEESIRLSRRQRGRYNEGVWSVKGGQQDRLYSSDMMYESDAQEATKG